MQSEKTAIGIAPNEQLRWERQRRGWSRAYIAEQIGVADPKTIGRWERGGAFPSAYFLQKLCALFQMPAEELGLWQRNTSRPMPEHAFHPYAYLSESPRYQALSETAIYDPELPPAPADGLIGRESLLRLLRLRLCAGHAGRNLTTAALKGLPGVGKTAVALELANAPEIQDYFSDGILWVSLGPDADLPTELRRWGELLEIEEQSVPRGENIESWMRAIHTRIGSRKMLLIIDDAWTAQSALTFKIGGANCSYLLTTRVPGVALAFSSTGTFQVDALHDEASTALLTHLVPSLVEQAQEEIQALIRLIGGLPLALQAIGQHLRIQIYSGQPRRWQAALEHLQDAPTRLLLSMPRAPLEQPSGLPVETPVSLQSVIGLSYSRLDRSSRRALGLLANLPNTVSGFGEATALALGVSLDDLDKLQDSGLLESREPGRYTLHQTIRDFALWHNTLRKEEHLSNRLPKTVVRARILHQLQENLVQVQENALFQDAPQPEILPAFVYEAGTKSASASRT